MADASLGVLSGTRISPFHMLRRHFRSAFTVSGGDLRRDWRDLRANRTKMRGVVEAWQTVRATKYLREAQLAELLFGPPRLGGLADSRISEEFVSPRPAFAREHFRDGTSRR